jgi:hypothetical protein
MKKYLVFTLVLLSGCSYEVPSWQLEVSLKYCESLGEEISILHVGGVVLPYVICSNGARRTLILDND